MGNVCKRNDDDEGCMFCQKHRHKPIRKVSEYAKPGLHVPKSNMDFASEGHLMLDTSNNNSP